MKTFAIYLLWCVFVLLIWTAIAIFLLAVAGCDPFDARRLPEDYVHPIADDHGQPLDDSIDRARIVFGGNVDELPVCEWATQRDWTGYATYPGGGIVLHQFEDGIAIFRPDAGCGYVASQLPDLSGGDGMLDSLDVATYEVCTFFVDSYGPAWTSEEVRTAHMQLYPRVKVR